MRIEKRIVAAVYVPAHTETTKIYKFHELETSLQKKLIDEMQNKLIYDEQFWDDWSITARDEFEETIIRKIPGIDKLDVSFSLSYCQGDGVSFTGEVTGRENITELLTLVYSGKIPFKIKRIIPFIYSIQFNRNHNIRYCHKYSVDTSVIDNYNDISHDRFLSLVETMEKAIEEYRLDLCKQLENAGYNSQDYFTSKEYAEEKLIENEFYASGETV